MVNSEPYLGKSATNIPVSNSEIQTWKDCKRKWWLTYYRGFLPAKREVVGPLPLGTRVHTALEVYYRDGVDLVEAYNSLFQEDEVVFDQSDKADQDDVRKKFYSEGEMGRIMLEGYVEWLADTGADADYTVVDLESAMQYTVLDGRVNLIGKADIRLIDRTDDTMYIGDFKTAAQMKPYYDVTHMSEQLMLYTALANMTEDIHVTGGVYIVFKKVKRTASSKPPFYERFTVRFNKSTMESFWTRLLSELSDMVSDRDRLDSGEDHLKVVYPSPTNDCVWKCPFFSVCPMFDDGSDAEGWLRRNMKQGDPYGRYQGTGIAPPE